MNHDPKTSQLVRASKALEGYEEAAFPGKSSLLGRDKLYSSALLAALICDLEHYANQHDLSFAHAVNVGRSAHAEEAAEQATYFIGDHVRLLNHDGRCGTIIGWATIDDHEDRLFLIVVPGVSRVYDERAADLEPAPPFPATSTTTGEVTHALQAESAYIGFAARIPRTAPSLQPALRQDCQKLLSALSTWSGVSVPELLKGLHPKVTKHTETFSPKDDDRASTFEPSLEREHHGPS
ncbi:hypothetical protein [Actinomadura sediminis]|uniref:Uncharacterized protein n=1 Tax=Actinomadura sediminis TaxID=1038904 RepID=A0ABW3EJZ9_9ACTN